MPLGLIDNERAKKPFMEKAGMTYYKKDINTRENQECVFYQIKLR